MRALLRSALPVSALLVACGGGSSSPSDGALGVDEVLALQVRGGVCEPSDGPSASSVSRAWSREPTSPTVDSTLEECAAAASTCAAFDACLGVVADAPAGACEPAGSACEGSVLESCPLREGQAVLRRVDCAEDPSGNARCVESLGGPVCAARACMENRETCDGDVAVRCSAGAEVREDCALAGRACVRDPLDRAECVDRVESCDFTTRCVGDVFEACVNGAGVRALDCVALDDRFICEDVVGDPRCTARRPECGDGEVACEADVARVCVEGVWVDFDCGRFEGRTCRVSGPTVSCAAE